MNKKKIQDKNLNLKPSVLFSVFQENSLTMQQPLSSMNCLSVSNLCNTELGPLTE